MKSTKNTNLKRTRNFNSNFKEKIRKFDYLKKIPDKINKKKSFQGTQ